MRVKKLKLNIFSGDMRVGKNTFCFAECAALRAVRGAKQQENFSEFRRIQKNFPHVPPVGKARQGFFDSINASRSPGGVRVSGGVSR